mgnify:CR=1 FL=1
MGITISKRLEKQTSTAMWYCTDAELLSRQRLCSEAFNSRNAGQLTGSAMDGFSSAPFRSFSFSQADQSSRKSVEDFFSRCCLCQLASNAKLLKSTVGYRLNTKVDCATKSRISAHISTGNKIEDTQHTPEDSQAHPNGQEHAHAHKKNHTKMLGFDRGQTDIIFMHRATSRCKCAQTDS